VLTSHAAGVLYAATFHRMVWYNCRGSQSLVHEHKETLNKMAALT
jgi:hypothetical protein